MGYDLFFSYARADQATARPIADALRANGLKVFIDERDIDDFKSITESIATALGQSKALFAYYSSTYPRRPACQWELTSAYLASEREMLAAERKDRPGWRILLVNPEVRDDHIHPIHLRDIKRPPAPPPGDTAALEQLAHRIARRVGGLTGTFGDIPPLARLRWFPEPGLGSTHFVGRFAALWEVHTALHPEAAVLTVGRRDPPVAQVRGLGGIGKSLLAEVYALQFGAAYPGGVFWLRSSGSHDGAELGVVDLEARMDDQLRSIARTLNLAVEDCGPEELLGLLAAEIERVGQPCLWVVDDLPARLDSQQVARWVAPHPLAHTLLTTRSRGYDRLARAVDLEALDQDEAYELLTAERRPAEENEKAAAREIVEDLGGHALAVDIARAMCGAHISYAGFRASPQSLEKDELEFAAEFAGVLPRGHERSIAATLMRSIAQLGDDGRDFLRVAAMLAPAPIPTALVAAVRKEADGLRDQEATRRAQRGVGEAESLSLARKAAEDTVGTWLVHALVTRTVRLRERDTMPPESSRARPVTSRRSSSCSGSPNTITSEGNFARLNPSTDRC